MNTAMIYVWSIYTQINTALWSQNTVTRHLVIWACSDYPGWCKIRHAKRFMSIITQPPPFLLHYSRQPRGVEIICYKCWASVADGGPTLSQSSLKASCLRSYPSHICKCTDAWSSLIPSPSGCPRFNGYVTHSHRDLKGPLGMRHFHCCQFWKFNLYEAI